MEGCRIFGYILCFLLYWISGIHSQEYVVPVYVRADKYGTDHFKIPTPKYGPQKSSFHLEQLIKLENELLGLSGLILETEAKLHARKKLQKVEDDKRADKLKDGAEKHEHNYTRETRYLEAVTDKNSEAMKNLQSYVMNPLAMFSVRKRLADSWPYIMDNITECSMVAEHVAINDHFKNVNRKLKRDGDLEMAYDDLLRLQKTYNVPVSSLARGWLLDEVTDPLSLEDIIAIANICLNREDLKGALEWLLQVAKFLKTMGLQGKLKTKYMHILGGAYLRLNRLQEAKLVYGQLLKEDSESRIANANMKLIEEKMKYEAAKEEKEKESSDEAKKKTKKGKTSKGKLEEKKGKKDEGYKEDWWMKHCRGDLPPLYERETHLKSYVKTIPISGVKYRVTPLSIYPPVYLIYDVLQNFTISKLIEVTTKEITEKIHSYSQPDEASAPVYWNDQNYWMEKFTYTMRNLTYQRYNVDSHVKLNLLGAVRVYNVGAGGTSNPGRGEIRITPRSTWERNFIGRLVTFLNTPKAGGDFVFPWLRIRVKPVKGAALYWQFRSPTSLVSPKLYHWLECPVLLGEYWYAEQMIEHHKMMDTIDLAYREDSVKVDKSKAKKKKVLKKKRKPVKQEEEEEEEVEEAEDEEEVVEDYEEEEEGLEVEESEEDEGDVGEEEELDEEEEEEEIQKPKKKIVKKVAPKTEPKTKDAKEKPPQEAKTKTAEKEKLHPKEAKTKMADKEKQTMEKPKEKPAAAAKTEKTEKTPVKKKKVKKIKKKVVKK